jgi:hypothetical protein
VRSVLKVHVDVPLHLQPLSSCWCVPDGILGVLNYFGIHTSKKEVRDGLSSHIAGGTQIQNVRPFLRKLGLKTTPIKLEYHTMLAALESGLPIVLCYAFVENDSLFGHFSVVVGVRRDRRGVPFVTLSDTVFGRFEVPLAVLTLAVKNDWNRWVRVVEEV